MFILFFILLYLSAVKGKIIIKDAGVYTISRGDLGMIFYISLHNTDSSFYHITVKKLKCCEYLKGNDRACDFMDLLGGDMGKVGPRCHKNISVLYPNMYLHDRRGLCSLKIKYKNKNHRVFQTVAKIVFDTTVCRNDVPAVLKGYYYRRDVSVCKTIDLNTLQNCEEVDCQVKYLGSRNYFNRKWNRCQKVPVCIANPEIDLPDVAYSPVSNMCKDLNQPIAKHDLINLETMLAEGKLNLNYNIPTYINIRCHNGYYNNQTASCDCFDGWLSEDYDKDEFEPSLTTYHMCNMATGTWYELDKAKIRMTALIIAILAVAVAMIVVLISFILHLVYIFIQSFEKNALQDDCECGDWNTTGSHHTSIGPSSFCTEKTTSKENQNPSSEAKSQSTVTKSIQDK